MSNKIAEKQTSFKSNNSQYLILFVLIVLILLLQIILASNLLKFNRAEIFFAECAREMLNKHSFILPLFHDKPFFDKPILTYWLIALSFKVFGYTHLAARLPSIISSLIVNIGIIICCVKFYSLKLAKYAIILLNSSILYLSFTVSCMSDMLLICFDFLTMILLYHNFKYNSNKYLYLAAISASIAFLVKGPIAIVLPGLSYLIFLVINKKIKLLNFKNVFLSLVVFMIIACPWFIVVYQKSGMQFINYFFFHENLARYTGSNYDTHKPIYFMLVSLLLGFIPWSLFVPIAIYNFCQDGLKKAFNSFDALGYIFATVLIVFFSLSRGKIDYYILPVFPFLSFSVARALVDAIKNKHFYAFIYSLAISICAVITGVMLFLSIKSFYNLNFLLVAVLSVVAVVNIFYLFKKNLAKAYNCNFVMVFYLIGVYAVLLAPELNKLQPAIGYGCQIKKIEDLSHGIKLGIFGQISHKWADELTFMTGLEPIVINNSADAANFSNLRGLKYLIISEQDFEDTNFKNFKIIQSLPSIPKSLTPSYWFKNHNNLSNNNKLMLLKRE